MFRKLFAHEHHLSAALDSPAWNRIQGRRAQRLSTAETEAGVMPRAPDRVLDNQSIGERSVIVGAMGTHRKELTTGTSQHGVLVADAPEHDSTVRKGGDRNPSAQVRPCFGLGITHTDLTLSLRPVGKVSTCRSKRVPSLTSYAGCVLTVGDGTIER
jgi:hypothetical protein